MMEDAYGIGITNRYEFLCDTEGNDLQAILKKKAKKAKKAAKKLATEKENSENDPKVDNVSEKVSEEKKVKFAAVGKQLQPQQPKLRSMKETQNIRIGIGNGNGNGNRDESSETKANSDRNTGTNKYENREQKFNRRNREGGFETSDGGNRTNRSNFMSNGGNRTFNGNRNNEQNNVQDLEYNQQNNNQRERNDDRPPRRQGNDRNFGNKRFGDGQRRTFDGRGGKREFDRQSGSDKTGVKSVDKREGGGAHNWGTHKQDIDDLNKTNSDTDLKDDVNGDGNAKSEENLAEETKEVILVTLDEYKAQQGQRAKPQFNIRKAGEGEDATKWKKMIELQNRKKKGEGSSEDEYEFDPTMYPQRVGRQKRVVDIKFCFNEARRGGFNRGRPRRDRREFDDRRNGDAHRQNAPAVDDRNFPSLG